MATSIQRTAPVLMLVWALSGLPEILQAWQASSDLQIIVLSGEDAANIIQTNTAVSPLVEVRDKNNLPVAGAIVVFVILGLNVGGGKGAAFGNGRQEVQLMTDSAGRAQAGELQLLDKGSFRIQVNASYQGVVATATINQTNFVTAADAIHAGKTPGASKSSAGSGSNGFASNGAAAGGVAAGSASTTAAAAPAAAAAPGGGMSTLAMVGLAAGATAGTIGVVQAVQQSSRPDCSSQQDRVISSLNNEYNICSNPRSTENQCLSAFQTVLNDIGRYCSCAGSAGDAPSDVRQAVREFLSLGRQLGVNTNAVSSCGF